MPQGYYTEVVAILRANGCERVRQGKGAHEIWRNLRTHQAFTVSTHLKSRHTANEIMQQAGIVHKF